MADLFLKIANMSIAASWLVLVVTVLRLLFKKAPKWITMLLWTMVAIRLVCPFSFENPWSLMPSSETISPEIMTDPTPALQSGIPIINNTLNPVITQIFTPDAAAKLTPLQIVIPVLGWIWAVGVVAMLAYTALTYLRLHRLMEEAVRHQDNIFFSENAPSPFVLGILKPRIYLPYHMEQMDMDYVIAHERAHIRRKDHWWKPLGFVLLSVHWFNPVMWGAYTLLCRDIELACDEKVVRKLGYYDRADYSGALLGCSVNRRSIAACPLAFGEQDVKKRIRTALNYQRPAVLVTVVALILCAATAVCFLTDTASGHGFGVRAIRIGQADGKRSNADAVLELDYLLVWDSKSDLSRVVEYVGPESGEYTADGMGEYDGSLGEHRLMIKFKKTEASDGFRKTYTPGQVYTLDSVPQEYAGVFKLKVVYPPDNSLVIYIGTDRQFYHKADYAFYNVRYLGGTMKVSLWLA